MKFFTTLLISVLMLTGVNAQSSIADTKIPLKDVPVVEMPRQDNQELKELELARRAPGVAPRFAVPMPVDITPFTHGTWEVLEDGTEVWRLRILSKDAYSLNFGFSEYRMPASGKLLFYSTIKKEIVGPFTSKDNETHGQLWTPIIDGDEIVLEVQISTQDKPNLRLRLTAVNHDFLGFSSGFSGSCNLDVICGADDGYAIVDQYRDIIQSVVVYGTGGTTFCTGAMINTTKNDCTPYLLTANHCMGGVNPSSLVVYWNFVNSFCRTPGSAASGGTGDGVLTDFNTGAIRIASYAPSDFFLLELDDPVSSTANAFFAGWDKGDALPSDTVIVIHHPSTDEKRISFEFDAPHLGNWGSGGDNIPTGNHVIIPDWDIGTTEGGSSGSPLFNKNKQIIGQLHGGGAACGNNEYDSFGWIAASWEGGGSADSRLKDWLDPNNTGVTNIDGRSQLVCSFSVLAQEPVINLCAPSDAVYTINVSDNFTGNVTLDVMGLPNDAVALFADNPVAPGMTTTLTISSTDLLSEGTYNFTLIGSDGTNDSSSELILNVSQSAPNISGLLPDNNTIDMPLNVNFGWSSSGTNATYDFQLATDADFNNLLMDVSELNTTNISSIILETETSYFWRVRGSNICGAGDWSDVFTFTTGAIACGGITAGDLPIVIDAANITTITSTINYSVYGNISEVKVQNLNITHSWVGDLKATLTSPSGTVVTLFDQPGVPVSQYGCDGDNVMLNFYDEATSTADDLENMCGGTIALEGDFQPVDLLEAFAGESANGDWVLTISDAVAEDGGSLDNWSLFICTTIPNEAAVFPSVTEIEVCPEEAYSFEVVVGTGFDGNVTFEFSGLPVDAVVEVDQMIIEPGDNVNVTVSNLPEGDYNLELLASDGSQSDTANIAIHTLSPISAPNLLLPADETIDAATGMTFSWSAISEAISYMLVVANDPDFNDVFFMTNTSATNVDLMGLDFSSTYYWQVIPVGICGNGVTSSSFSFTTIPNLATTINPTEVDICQSDEVTITIVPGIGFSNPASVTVQATSGIQPEVSYNIDPNQVIPGESFTATISNFGSLTEQTFDLMFTITDGTYSQVVSSSITFSPVPTLPSIIAPENGGDISSPSITFDWYSVSNATGYLFELATDEAFSNIIVSENVAPSIFTLEEIPGELGVYFWRVTAINECGQATTTPFSFNFVVATYELAGRKVEIFPNPSSDQVNISFSIPFEEDLSLEFYDINGRLLKSTILAKGVNNQFIDVRLYPAGIYLLKISGDTGSLVERIVIDK